MIRPVACAFSAQQEGEWFRVNVLNRELVFFADVVIQRLPIQFQEERCVDDRTRGRSTAG